MMYHFTIVIFGSILSTNKYLYGENGYDIRTAYCYLTSIARVGKRHARFTYGEES